MQVTKGHPDAILVDLVEQDKRGSWFCTFQAPEMILPGMEADVVRRWPRNLGFRTLTPPPVRLCE